MAPAVSASLQPLAMAGELTLQPFGHLVQGALQVPPRPLGPEHAAASPAGDLHTVAAVDPGVVLHGELDLDPPDPGVDPTDLGKLRLRPLAHRLGDPDAATLQDEIHGVLLPSALVALVETGGPGPADLVFGPTLAC